MRTAEASRRSAHRSADGWACAADPGNYPAAAAAEVVDRSILVIVDLVRYSSCLFFLVVVLSPALRLIFFGLLCSCQLLLGTMAAFLSQPSARSGRTLFGQLGRDGCYVPRLCTRCLPAHRA